MKYRNATKGSHMSANHTVNYGRIVEVNVQELIDTTTT